MLGTGVCGSRLRNVEIKWNQVVGTNLYHAVLPHEAVAEVSIIGNVRRDWLLWITDDKAKTLTLCPTFELTT